MPKESQGPALRVRNGNLIELINAYRLADPIWNPLPVSDTQVQQWYETGLASVALRVLGDNFASLPDHSRSLLKNADLTARIVYGQLRDATIEILKIACDNDISVALLKGISVGHSIYAEPHDRLMSDVDILVLPNDAERLQGLLTSDGYWQACSRRPDGMRPGHHHLEPLEHARSGVAVEIHTALFSARPVCDQDLFQEDSVWRYTAPTQYHGLPCYVLQPELRLLYTVAHWAIDHNWPVHVIGILDVVLMLHHGKDTLDWRLIDQFLTDNPVAADYFAVLVQWLNRAGLAEVPPLLAGQIENSTDRIGSTNIRLIHRLIFAIPLADCDREPSTITRITGRIIFQTMFERRPKSLRLVVAISRVFFRRTPGRSMSGSLIGRIKSVIDLMD